jgi:dienelactone hydrolase
LSKYLEMKIIKIIIGFLFIVNNAFAQRPDFLKKDSIKAALDGNIQVFYYDKSTASRLQPLVVELHSWSNSAASQEKILAVQSHAKGWNFIFPNFRGINNHPKACCSEFVIADIDEAIDWALKNMPVDPKRIYVIGNSGGGYATMAMYMKSRHKIKSFSAWSSIADLAAWYGESVERKNKYAAEIIKCIGTNAEFDAEKAKERSPLHWKTPVKKRKRSALQIYVGVHDGYTGSVPISQSINFYNKLLTDANQKDTSLYVSQNDAAILLKTQSFTPLKPLGTLGDRAILYQKQAKKIRLTVFEGTHEILNDTALEIIDNAN